MVELMNILLNASRELPNDMEYGYFCRKLIDNAKEIKGDSRTLQELASKIIFELKKQNNHEQSSKNTIDTIVSIRYDIG